MVTMVDRNVGQVLDLLKELDLEDNTIVFFTGDNGGQDRFASKQYPRGYFGPNVDPKTGVEFRGGKGNLYEGGLRIPFLVRWPGKIEPGRVSDLLCLPAGRLAHARRVDRRQAPRRHRRPVDSAGTARSGNRGPRAATTRVSLLGVLARRPPFACQNWKAIRPKPAAPWELYDLQTDISESTNVADAHPDIVARTKAFAEQSHVDAQPGTYRDRTRHERDRQAKWGTSRADAGGADGNARPARVKRRIAP